MTPFDPVVLLRRRGLLTSDDVTAEPLKGGYLNQVLRLRGEGIDWVVKRFAAGSGKTLFPNLPRDEYRALQAASALDLAPRPVAFLDEADAPVLVYGYCPGLPWRDGVEGVGGLLRRLRAIDASGFRPVPMTPAAILSQGDDFLPAAGGETRQRLKDTCPRPIEATPVAPSFLHTDLGPGNIIVDGDDLRVIDWQCPAAGDAVEDIAAFLSPAFQILYGCPSLTAEQERAFFAAYGDRDTETRYDLLRPFYDWRMACYCAFRVADHAERRPEASAAYARAVVALLHRLETKR
ncbi:MAG TPA: aminoglycoside phosphotransferase family protein [Candidatus Binatia bacterium]|nr:aminoglycoside phosphotransferase family protein [Candidatus Binatia bacterium]